MIIVAYPPPNFEIKKLNNTDFLFDKYRKKWVVLTPEEWVRQNFLAYLIQQLNYPASLMAIEKEFTINNTKKRADIVCYKHSKPFMIVECKEMNVPITPQVLQQALQYNMALQVRYIVLTNGNNTYAWMIENEVITELNELPVFSS